MRSRRLTAMLIVFATSLHGEQQTNSRVSPQPGTTDPDRVKVYAVGPGVTAPTLIVSPPQISIEKCKEKVDGKVLLSIIVDATGRPRNLMFLRPLGTDLDKFALQIVGSERFTPGTFNGSPVAVGQSLEVNLQTCLENTTDDQGRRGFLFQLRSVPVQKLGPLPQPPAEVVFAPSDTFRAEPKSDTPPPIEHIGGSVSSPVPLTFPAAQFTEAARRANHEGISLISLIVDAQGLPQDLHVAKSLGYGLDENAMDAIRRYRFKPAMTNGEPVPVRVTIEVKFVLRQQGLLQQGVLNP